jgi:1-acyl-sn-glycerol-3-phosphate acyltransferase
MRLIYRTARCGVRLWCRLYCRWEVIGREKVPQDGPVIIAANHVSYLDPPLVGSAIDRECAFMARHSLWDNRLLGWLITRLNAFPVHRDRPDRGVFRRALEALEKGLVLVLFPEGTRSLDGRLQRGEPGVAFIVQKSGAKVVPCALIGPEKMLPPGAKKLTRTRITILFGDPIVFPPQASREEIAAAIMRAIAALLTAHGVPAVAAEDCQPSSSSR